ncbi:MAG: argininosuccinate lyase [Thermoleophilia bacterium]|nr:argininosuccinate lyase [Thermoleophilia bacterium]
MSDDGVRLWGGRFAGGPAEAFAALNDSLSVDRRMWREDIAGSRAHARMLTATGVLSAEDGRAIDGGLCAIAREMEAGDFAFQPSDEDIHTAVERRLTEIAGDAGRRLHTGRSRNDQVATDVLVYLASTCDGQARLVARLAAVLLDAADAHVDTLLPGYTHLQRAQPVRLAHHLAAYAWMLVRDRDRLAWAAGACRAFCPLGSGALAGVGFPIDRGMTAAELGFDRPGPNSLDGVGSRDALADYLHAAATLGVHLSRLGQELVLWSSEEVGFVELSDAFTSGSSMLPQKKNPDAAELARAKVARLVADYSGLQGVVAGLPLAYNKDLQEDKHFLFDAVDTLDLLLPAMIGMMEGARFDAGRMGAATEDGFLAATDLADHLVRLGWPFRRAHEAVGALVRACVDAGHGLERATPDQLASAGLGDVDLPEMTAAASVEAKLSTGGTGRAAVLDQLAAARVALAG